MEPSNHHPRSSPEELPPRAAWLMAYLDGELPPDEKARVESWISEDPDAYHQVEENRRLRDCFTAAPIADPSSAAWETTLARIESRVAGTESNGGAPPSRRRPSGLWIVAGLTAAAAAAGIWFGAGKLLSPPPEPDQPTLPTVEILAVAGLADVVIDDMDPADLRSLVVGRMPGDLPDELREMRPLAVAEVTEIAVETMHGDDTDRLVIGEPPVMGDLLMASPGEVVVNNIATEKGEPTPYLWQPGGGGGMPMINVRLKTARRD